MGKLDRTALRRAILSSIPAEPSQYDSVKPEFVYIPPSHVRALDPDAMLVEGIRGAGKSFWWHALQSEKLRPRLLTQRAQSGESLVVTAGFGQGTSPDWPEKDELTALLSAGHKPRLIWKTVVLRQIAPDVVPGASFDAATQWVTQNPSLVAEAIRRADARLRGAGQRHLILFDALDRTADLRSERQRLLRGLIELVLELRALGSVRAKVFVRPDMLDDPEVTAFPDASKVIASRVSLDWRSCDLYGLFFTYLGNGSDAEAAAYFRTATGLDWHKHGAGMQLPILLREDARSQEAVFIGLAGPYMGTDKRRGKTYTWVPNHLGDAANKVSPRSFLAALRRAAEVAEAPGQAYALHFSGIQEGVRKASEYRVTEVSEDLPWAHEAMEMLGDLVVPCSSELLIKSWRRGKLLPPLAREAGRAPTDADLADTLNQLSKVKILELLPGGRVNIPDVYRVGFGMRRRGGFAPT